MPEKPRSFDFDVGIEGAGPAGLSAANVLGRSCRRVDMFDDGRPRNYAARSVHCYLGHDGITPSELRNCGRSEASFYGAVLIDAEVIAVDRLSSSAVQQGGFCVRTNDRSFTSRALLLATGVIDRLPDIPNVEQFYGRSIHHCPYCDGWEHRDERLLAFGTGGDAVELALTLCNWSSRVTVCTHGVPLSANDRARLHRNGVPWREERVIQLRGQDGALSEVVFSAGDDLPCDALFFSGDQAQRSPFAKQFGCDSNGKDLIQTGKK
jgi:thioredoxin reductase